MLTRNLAVDVPAQADDDGFGAAGGGTRFNEREGGVKALILFLLQMSNEARGINSKPQEQNGSSRGSVIILTTARVHHIFPDRSSVFFCLNLPVCYLLTF